MRLPRRRSTHYAVKLKGMMAIAPEWEYDGQDGMYQVKDYQRIPTPDMTAVQQVRYIEVLQRVALEEGVHLRTSSNQYEIHVAPINCSPEDDAWDITYTFVKTDRLTGLKADISNLEPVHVATASTDPIDSGFKRAVADGDLGRSFRVWAHTFVSKTDAVRVGTARSVWRGRVGLDQASRTLPQLPSHLGGGDGQRGRRKQGG